MNTLLWTRHFLANRNTFTEPPMPHNGSSLPDQIKTPLVRSLAIFQLGESGGGTRLMKYVRHVVSAEQLSGYETAVQLFVDEEQHHARLLAKLVGYLGGACLKKQWTNSVFRWLRNHFGVEFNIQVLLTAELIAEAYFGLLYRNVSDHAVRKVCHRLLQDEMRHIAFHTEFLHERLEAKPRLWRKLWRTQFALLHTVTACVVAYDHRECLKAAGVSPRAFTRMTWKAGTRFLRRLQGRQRLWMARENAGQQEVALP